MVLFLLQRDALNLEPSNVANCVSKGKTELIPGNSQLGPLAFSGTPPIPPDFKPLDFIHQSINFQAGIGGGQFAQGDSAYAFEAISEYIRCT
ncbi:hypothetical protein HUJ05_002481 [Dendroctonus ponderosae]|nr:hypothetical protein HUJ05_002481 [Dendroctonus ponderosae]